MSSCTSASKLERPVKAVSNCEMRGWASRFPERAWKASRTVFWRCVTGSEGLTRACHLLVVLSLQLFDFPLQLFRLLPGLIHCLDSCFGCRFQPARLWRAENADWTATSGVRAWRLASLSASQAYSAFACIAASSSESLKCSLSLEPVQDLCQIDIWRGGRFGVGRVPRFLFQLGTWAAASGTPGAPEGFGAPHRRREPQSLEAAKAASPAIRNARPTISLKHC